ncbi:hypothetical protein TNCV_4956791 [Trichonephila clavipes]|nr:hypothetical protein TNCV_4956791 [Trichonephila clavipes]
MSLSPAYSEKFPSYRIFLKQSLKPYPICSFQFTPQLGIFLSIQTSPLQGSNIFRYGMEERLDVVTYATRSTVTSDQEVHESHRGKRLHYYALFLNTVCLGFEHHVGDSAILLGSTPILRENTLGWSGSSHLSPPCTNLTRGLTPRLLFRVPLCCDGTIHLQLSMSSPGYEPGPTAQQSMSLTTTPDEWLNNSTFSC